MTEEEYQQEVVWQERLLEETLDAAEKTRRLDRRVRDRIWDIVNNLRKLEREKPWSGCL